MYERMGDFLLQMGIVKLFYFSILSFLNTFQVWNLS